MTVKCAIHIYTAIALLIDIYAIKKQVVNATAFKAKTSKKATPHFCLCYIFDADLALCFYLCSIFELKETFACQLIHFGAFRQHNQPFVCTSL